MVATSMADHLVGESDAGVRADVFVARVLGISRSQAARLVATGLAPVNRHLAKPGTLLRLGDVVTAHTPTKSPSSVGAESIPLDVVYEDADLLIVNKPSGMVVHPAPGHRHGTLVNAVLGHAGEMHGVGDEARPGIVHRLDRDTSGLIAIAKSDHAHAALQAQIRDRTARREYLAVLWGRPPFATATINAAIGRHPGDRKRMAVLADDARGARSAVTELIIAEYLGPFSLAHARLHTGRTHQIRVHCAHIGHPVVGDPVYGRGRKPPEALRGQALHAWRLAIQHPRTEVPLQFEAEPPEDLCRLLDALRSEPY
jgi:23S rRNA pseudouridine1911/1915/1917 synthase